MTYDQIVSTALLRLGNRPTLRPIVEAELQLLVETELEHDPQFKPWFLQSDGPQDLTLTTSGNVALPTDFLAEYAPGALWVVNSSGGLNELLKKDYAWLLAKYRDENGITETGELPQKYAVVNNKLYCFPIPTASVTLRLMYYQSSGFTKDDDTNPWVVYAGDYLIAAVTAAVAQSIGNKEVLQIAEARKSAARHRLMAETEEREEMNQDTRLGSEPA